VFRLPFDRAAFLEKLKASYDYYYEIKYFDTEQTGALPLVMSAESHIRDEGYVLVKSAKIWAAESNEFVYVFSAPSLDKAMVARCIDQAIADGEAKINPHPEHKNSFIIAVFVADWIDPDAQTEIRKRKFGKSYKMGFHGWSTLKTAAVDIKKEMITVNKAGEDQKKFFKKLLRSEKV
jgi:hypothetical protein